MNWQTQLKETLYKSAETLKEQQEEIAALTAENLKLKTPAKENEAVATQAEIDEAFKNIKI
ncbi:MAG: hypothetical protein H7096_11280 [Flavobacterium sp.]|nr:hypothetical protein [Pedobacter sp.]